MFLYAFDHGNELGRELEAHAGDVYNVKSSTG